MYKNLYFDSNENTLTIERIRIDRRPVIQLEFNNAND